VCLLSLLVAAPFISYSQSTRPLLITVGAGIDEHVSSTRIVALANGEACGMFTNGSGAGTAFSLGLGIPFEAAFSFAPSIRFQDLSAHFITQPTNVQHGFQSGGLVEINRTRRYEATLSQLTFGAIFSYNVTRAFALAAGPTLGALLTHSYSETESITTPSTASYSNTSFSQTRAISSGTISGIQKFQAGVQATAGYTFQFGSIGITPELQANLPLTSISSNPWRTYTIGAGITLSRVLVAAQAEPIHPPIVERLPIVKTPEPAPKPKSMISVTMRVVGIDNNGQEVNEPTLSIERVHVTEVFPTLNSVFFDQGDSTIPIRYHQFVSARDIRDFNDSDLYRANALEINHFVLDVIGKRLSMYPDASLTITGTTSSSEERGNPGLSLTRARVVANYLHTIWSIDLTRLELQGRTLPETPSDESTTTGQAENRRIDLSSNVNDVLAPLWTERIERVASPPKIVFHPHIILSRGLDSLVITVRQGDHILQRFDGRSDGSAGEHLWTLNESSTPNGEDSLIYTCRVVDSIGNVATTSGVIHMRRVQHDTVTHRTEDIADKHLERYSLILFDYSSSQFGRRQAELLIDTIARSVDKFAEVTLTGHTDQTGDPAFNNRLSGERASTTADALRVRWRHAKHPLPHMSVEAHGSRDILFDNALPEGRFLSRTVRIMVEHDSVSKK
jgi:outer membrane protein OmpA-like peptidoglycan-associated protein